MWGIGYFQGVSDGAPTTGRLAGNTLVTAVSQVVTMGLGALLALLVLFVFGTTPKTDGLFTAYGVYGVLLMLAQSLRTTIVARLVEAPSLWEAFDRYLGAALALALAAAVPLVVLADPLAHLLTGHATGEAHDAARTGLRLFALAGGAQLLAAIGAAALGALDRFVAVSVAYLAAGAVSIAGVAVLAAPLDVDAVPAAVAVGSLRERGAIGASLLAGGWRPHRRLDGSVGRAGAARVDHGLGRGALRRLAGDVRGQPGTRGTDRQRRGERLVAYAFFAASFVVGASSGSVGIVLAAPLAQGWDRSPSSLTPHLRTIVRLGATLIVPVLGVAAIAGDDLSAAVFGLQAEHGRHKRARRQLRRTRRLHARDARDHGAPPGRLRAVALSRGRGGVTCGPVGACRPHDRRRDDR